MHVKARCVDECLSGRMKRKMKSFEVVSEGMSRRKKMIFEVVSEEDE